MSSKQIISGQEIEKINTTLCSDLYNIRLLKNTGKTASYFSSISPTNEADRILHFHRENNPSLIVIQGAGNIYLIEKASLLWDCPIWVISCDPHLAKLSQQIIRIRKASKEKKESTKSKILFFPGKEFFELDFQENDKKYQDKESHFHQSEGKHDSAEKFDPDEYLEKFFSPLAKQLLKSIPSISKKILFLKNQKETRMSPDYFEKAKKTITSAQNQKSVNRSTFRRFEKLWLKQLSQNTVKIAYSFPLHLLLGEGKNKDALIIGPGPSVENQLTMIEKNQKLFFIIALDTVVKPLLQAKIIPDAIVSIDPQKINSKYLENLQPVGNINPYQKCLLLAEPSVCPRAIRHFERIYFFDTFFPFYKLIANTFGYRGEINSGGSVLSTAYELARIMHFRTLTLAGIDLSYFLDSYHLKGSMYEQYWLENIDRFTSFESKLISITEREIPLVEKNPHGEKIFLDTPMILYRQWLESQDSFFEIFCNLSETGADIKGTERMTFGQLNDSIHHLKTAKQNAQSSKKSDTVKKSDIVTVLLEKEKSFLNDIVKEKDGGEWQNRFFNLKKFFISTTNKLEKISKAIEKQLNEYLSLSAQKKSSHFTLRRTNIMRKLTVISETISKDLTIRDLISATMQETISKVVQDGLFDENPKNHKGTKKIEIGEQKNVDKKEQSADFDSISNFQKKIEYVNISASKHKTQEASSERLTENINGNDNPPAKQSIPADLNGKSVLIHLDKSDQTHALNNKEKDGINKSKRNEAHRENLGLQKKQEAFSNLSYSNNFFDFYEKVLQSIRFNQSCIKKLLNQKDFIDASTRK